MAPIATFVEQAIRNDLGKFVRQTVEDALNGLLEEETDDLVGAERHERTPGRGAYRAGRCERQGQRAREVRPRRRLASAPVSRSA